MTAAQEEQYAAVMQALEARPKYAPAQAQALRLRALQSCVALAEKRLMAWRHLDTWLNNLQAEAAIAIAEAEQGWRSSIHIDPRSDVQTNGSRQSVLLDDTILVGCTRRHVRPYRHSRLRPRQNWKDEENDRPVSE